MVTVGSFIISYFLELDHTYTILLSSKSVVKALKIKDLGPWTKLHALSYLLRIHALLQRKHTQPLWAPELTSPSHPAAWQVWCSRGHREGNQLAWWSPIQFPIQQVAQLKLSALQSGTTSSHFQAVCSPTQNKFFPQCLKFLRLPRRPCTPIWDPPTSTPQHWRMLVLMWFHHVANGPAFVLHGWFGHRSLLGSALIITQG